MSAAIEQDDDEAIKPRKCQVCDGEGFDLHIDQIKDCWACRGTGIEQNFYPDADDRYDEWRTQ